MAAEKRQCQYRKRGNGLGNGKRCGAYARTNDHFCFFHSPATKGARQNARQAGGISRSQKVAAAVRFTEEIPSRPLRNPTDVSELLSDVVGLVLRRQLDLRTANTVGYLSATILRALEQGPAEARLAKVEAMLGITGNVQKEIMPNAIVNLSRPY
jgi:hypothetical protein